MSSVRRLAVPLVAAAVGLWIAATAASDTPAPTVGTPTSSDTPAPSDGSPTTAETAAASDGSSTTAETAAPNDGSPTTAETAAPSDGSPTTVGTAAPNDGSPTTAGTAALSDGSPTTPEAPAPPPLSAPASPPDLIYRAVTIPGGGLGHLLEIDPQSAELRVLDARDHGKPAMTAQEFGVATGAAAVINAPFFDVDGSPMGLLIVDGEERQPIRKADWGVFFIDARGAHIVHTRDYGRRSGVAQAFQVGPRLVVGGEALALKPQSARRTAICTRADGRVLAMVVGNMVLASDVARFFAEQGCSDALNLDGGPSSQLWLKSGGVAVEVSGGTGVPVALGVFPGRPAEQRARPERGCLR